MTPEALRDLPHPPSGASDALKVLWQDANVSWTAAHDTLQDDHSADGAWVHAYLHRKEGDLPNAAYWYRRAGKPVFVGLLEEEWAEIAAVLLREG